MNHNDPYGGNMNVPRRIALAPAGARRLRRAPGLAAVAVLLLAGSVAGWAPEAAAHDLFRAYVQHRLVVRVGAKYIDLSVELTFFEEWSCRERQLMDANRDGHISRSELESYLKKLAPIVSEQVGLRVGGHEVDLAPLYEPEVDLLGDDQTRPTRHRLRLFFFAARPATLRAGDELVIEDGLWPKAKALGRLEVEGQDGCALQEEKLAEPGPATWHPGQWGHFRVRCLRAPSLEIRGPQGRNAPG
jgi:hypothetical protein